MSETDPVVLRDLPIVRPASLPKNIKQEDTLLNKTEMTRSECDLLAKILGNRIAEMSYPQEEVAS